MGEIVSITQRESQFIKDITLAVHTVYYNSSSYTMLQ